MTLTVGGRQIQTTTEHPFWVKDRGWVEACDLAAGDELSTSSGEWVAIENVTSDGTVTTVYNMTVELWHTYFVGEPTWGFDIWVHNNHNNPANLLDDATRQLAEANIKKNGKTVLGPFYPEEVNYIKRADVKKASYFDIGKAWDDLTDAKRWAANQHFLDKIADAGDQVFLSIPKGKIRPDTYLVSKIKHLTEVRGYKWGNQWSLVPGN